MKGGKQVNIEAVIKKSRKNYNSMFADEISNEAIEFIREHNLTSLAALHELVEEHEDDVYSVLSCGEFDAIEWSLGN